MLAFMSLQEAPIVGAGVTDRSGAMLIFRCKQQRKQPGGTEGDRLYTASRGKFSHANREEFPGKSGKRGDALSG
jgi:hypothetical protein